MTDLLIFERSDLDITKTISLKKDHNDIKKTVNLLTELDAAHEMYPKVCDGFDDDGPPDVYTWLKNGDRLMNNWELFKVSTIGEIEHEETTKEKKDVLCDMLDSYTCVYMDLMSSIWLNFKDEITSLL